MMRLAGHSVGRGRCLLRRQVNGEDAHPISAHPCCVRLAPSYTSASWAGQRLLWFPWRLADRRLKRATQPVEWNSTAECGSKGSSVTPPWHPGKTRVNPRCDARWDVGWARNLEGTPRPLPHSSPRIGKAWQHTGQRTGAEEARPHRCEDPARAPLGRTDAPVPFDDPFTSPNTGRSSPHRMDAGPAIAWRLSRSHAIVSASESHSGRGA